MKAILWLLFVLVAVSSATRTPVLEAYDQEYLINDDPIAFVKAVKEFATRGNPCAQFAMGNSFLTGKGNPHNMTAALEWWEKAYTKQHSVAANNLGVIAWMNNCYGKAFKYFTNSCDWDFGHGCSWLAGFYYQNGCGAPNTNTECGCPVAANYTRAMELYQRSVELGCPAGAYVIGNEAINAQEPVIGIAWLNAARFGMGHGDGYDGNWLVDGISSTLTKAQLAQAAKITATLLKKYPRIQQEYVQKARHAYNYSGC
jgi:Sel1 repeat